MNPSDCDLVGGVCYEAMPEGMLILYLVLGSLVLHVLIVCLYFALDKKGGSE